jgi:hypothetical protein
LRRGPGDARVGARGTVLDSPLRHRRGVMRMGGKRTCGQPAIARALVCAESLICGTGHVMNAYANPRRRDMFVQPLNHYRELPFQPGNAAACVIQEANCFSSNVSASMCA